MSTTQERKMLLLELAELSAKKARNEASESDESRIQQILALLGTDIETALNEARDVSVEGYYK